MGPMSANVLALSGNGLIPGTDLKLIAPIYKIFDRYLRSELALPLQTKETEQQVTLEVVFGPTTAVDESGFQWFNEWKDDDGVISMAAAQRDGTYLIRFPGLADFTVDATLAIVQVFPSPATDEGVLAHLLVDQLIPRLLNQQGRLVVHASSVALPDGKVVAFLGTTGQGKSTLAAALMEYGCELITDDCLLLGCEQNLVLAVPAYRSLRLWPDSMGALFRGPSNFLPISPSMDKYQWILPDTSSIGVAARLAAVFVLSPPPGMADPSQSRIEALRGAEATMALVQSLFVLDIESTAVVQRNVQQSAQVAACGLPMFRLVYPRSYEGLSELFGMILTATSTDG